MRVLASLILALFLFGSCPAIAEAPALNPGSFVSPDAKFSLLFQGFSDGWYHYQIRNQKTGQIQDFSNPDLGLFGPLYSVEWTGDSQSILLVYHIADGSTAALLHYDGNSWHELDIRPDAVALQHPLKDDDFPIETVLEHRVDLRNIWILWGFIIRPAHAAAPEHIYTCGFNFDPFTRLKRHLLVHEVSTRDYRRLKAVHNYSQNPYPLAP